jgi:hypothetical protein
MMRLLLATILVLLALLSCGCTGVLPWFGGQEGELNQKKSETNAPMTITNAFPKGTTAIEAAQANAILLDSLTRYREAEAEASKAREEARRAMEEASSLTRYLWYAGIAVIILVVFFPGVALWLWKRGKELKKDLAAHVAAMDPITAKELQAKGHNSLAK